MSHIDFFYSFRSPYSYLSFDRVCALASELNIELRHRPIRPMVTRGVKLTRAKAMYILSDCKRIADELSIPFGPFADPLGTAVNKCLAVSQYAADEGRLEDFVRRASRAIWSEGVDLAEEANFDRICAESGLDSESCRRAVERREYLDRIEKNVSDHSRHHWGVPLLVYENEAFWGQDRIESLRAFIESKRS